MEDQPITPPPPITLTPTPSLFLGVTDFMPNVRNDAYITVMLDQVISRANKGNIRLPTTFYILVSFSQANLFFAFDFRAIIYYNEFSKEATTIHPYYFQNWNVDTREGITVRQALAEDGWDKYLDPNTNQYPISLANVIST